MAEGYTMPPPRISRRIPTIIATMQSVLPVSDLRMAQMIKKMIDMGMAIQLSIPNRGMNATRVMSRATIPKNVPIVQFVF